MNPPQRELRTATDPDGAVILDVERNTIIALNPTGSHIWERLRQQTPLSEIVSELARETQLDIAIVDGDVREFIQQLKTRGLVAD